LGLPGGQTAAGTVKLGTLLLVARAATQKHHLIPKGVFKRYKNLLPDEYKRDHAANLMTLLTPFHGNHPSYSRYVESKLNGLLQNGPITMDQMVNLQKHLKNKVDSINRSGAYERFNQYFKDLGY
jgi:A nuclease family of the HNH/ENDO VII superfamily with conserved AHH